MFIVFGASFNSKENVTNIIFVPQFFLGSEISKLYHAAYTEVERK